ncbi:hypothetical protein Sgou_14100 [Streptomyces gougerotii]|uniref:Uncharacterized protein n=2 Tax=Streptomyces diastaticus group TaxID=2849069 RepID=A0A8H9LX93_9ACTN|nr:hypothetical protein Srut_42780 [Streptomyces rutgersensis]GFH74438.1 hypothetical protein Sdia_52060 [Streptomyces diastaticus subsp. diastaticus]GFH76740.1 hypothetical protein Sgou_14100 [Streptomyces gougerotii]GGU02965.1 hypothetical protein GCM10015534_00750 [Streptomyces diastaticus subsp. diastaticus]GGU92547.1 hypothetical protein GCM10010227_54820 [Streptomyces gougerotii]
MARAGKHIPVTGTIDRVDNGTNRRGRGTVGRHPKGQQPICGPAELTRPP